MTSEWLSELKDISNDVEFLPAATPAAIGEAERVLGELPRDLKELLTRTNGLVCRSFRVFSAFDPQQPKKTWESLQRANDPTKTQALGGDRELLRRFLVFADIGGGTAAWDRTNDSIWFEETRGDELRQTDLALRTFVETMCRNAE